MRNQPLKGKVALVTGGTRGIGRGIALQLGEAGALVYVTGRTLTSKNGLGSLEETANEIKNRGGSCIPVQVDHEDDVQVAALFQKIESEQKGQLDILVNNAYKAVEAIFDSAKIPFWEVKPELWDTVNNVGLRNHYFCTVYASRMMVKRNQGLIVNISSYGGVRYLFNVPYGVGKAACDRMAGDCGVELKKFGVTMVSLYPGAVKTELVTNLAEKEPQESQMRQVFFNEHNETTEFSGKVIVHLAQNPNMSKYTTKTIISADYAQAHGIKDIDGKVVPSFRQFKFFAAYYLPAKYQFVYNFIPGFLKFPQFLLDIASSKF